MTLEDRLSIVQYRLERARRALNDASALYANDSMEGAMNRIYYAMFYAVSALALAYGFTTSKHSSLLGWFNKAIIHPGILSEKEGLLLRKSFEWRLQGDYADFVELDAEEVHEILERSTPFIETIQQLTLSRLNQK